MSLPRVIILADGQGSFTGELSATRHQALLPVDEEPLLVRTVRQLAERNLHEITVVVGHERAGIEQALAPWRDQVDFAFHAGYTDKANLGSVLAGLAGSAAPALMLEGAIIFDDDAMDRIAEVAERDDSVWFTCGRLRSPHAGGILRAERTGWIADLRYMAAYENRFSTYRRLLGPTLVGPREMPVFYSLLRETAARTTAQSYLMPWGRHLRELPARDCDLGDCRTATFDSPATYRRCCELFSHRVPV